MADVIYRTHDTLTGEMYVGAKRNYVAGKYFGTPCSKEARAIIKSRPETLLVEILETVFKDNILEREAYWQEYYNVVSDPMYWNRAISNKNWTTFGTTQTEEERKKKSESHKGKKFTPEHIAKIKAERNARINKPHTEERKRNITLALTGLRYPNRKKVSLEGRKNISDAQKRNWEKRKNVIPCQKF